MTASEHSALHPEVLPEAEDSPGALGFGESGDDAGEAWGDGETSGLGGVPLHHPADGPAGAARPPRVPRFGEDLSAQLVVTRQRADGWTPVRQREFLEALASSGSVAGAARSVGMSRESAYALRRRADTRGFAQAWDAARVLAGEHLLDLAWNRAVAGELRQIFYHGELVGETRHYDNRLLLGLIAQNHAALADGAAGAAVASPAIVAAVASDWEAALDRVERGEALDAEMPGAAGVDGAEAGEDGTASSLPPVTDAFGAAVSEAQALNVGLYQHWWDAALECWLTNWPAPADWDGQEYRCNTDGSAQLYDPGAAKVADFGGDDDDDAEDEDWDFGDHSEADDVPPLERYARSLSPVELAGLERSADLAAATLAQRLELYRRAAFGLISAAEQASLAAANGGSARGQAQG